MKVKQDLINLGKSYLYVATAIIIYSTILKLIFKDKVAKADFLNIKIFDFTILGDSCCSLWHISHFILYTILAFIWPQYWYIMFIAGILWELFELLMSHLTTPEDVKSKLNEIKLNNNNFEYHTWWGASKKDILFNSAGIIFGLSLNYLLKK